MLTASAFNALLLTLEEPPSHVVFILATTDIQDVPITILSRCQRFDFKPISIENIVSRLKYVCSEEKIKITDEALAEIALISAGGMRDALGMLDQLCNDDTEITIDMVSDYFGSVSVKKIDELLTGIEENNAEVVLEVLKGVKESGTNYAVFIEKLILELRKNAIDIKSGKAKHDMYFDEIYGLIFDLNECLCNVNINIDPYVLIEIVLLKYIKSDNEVKKVQDTQQRVVGNKKDLEDKADLGNNLVENNVEEDKKEYFLGNNGSEESKEVENKENLGNNSENSEDEATVEPVDNQEVINKVNIDLSVRINNCFVGASKSKKNSISESWTDFMNYLISKDRNMISLLADTQILAASNEYILIQSKVSSTNELINGSILDIERLYADFSGTKYKFAAINDELWSKETEKYRFNLKNKIKYNYIAEDSVESNDEEKQDMDSTVLDPLESVAKDIFGTYEVQ